MRKSSKQKKSKVPKLTEEQYAEYISSLKAKETSLPLSMPATKEKDAVMKSYENS